LTPNGSSPAVPPASPPSPKNVGGTAFPLTRIFHEFIQMKYPGQSYPEDPFTLDCNPRPCSSVMPVPIPILIPIAMAKQGIKKPFEKMVCPGKNAGFFTGAHV
ncbi:MAG: hypothetical protein ACOZBW_06645, partial [Thermodesulfobacteriota bacterium]